MASFTNQFTASDLAARIPEIWTPIVEEQFFPSTVAANFFLDLSEYATGGGNLFDIADLFTNVFTAQYQTTQGAQVTLQDPAQKKIQLPINTHAYVASLAGDKDIAQLMKSFSFNEQYAKKMSGTTANVLEAAIFGLWSSLTTNIITNSGAALTDLQVRQAINYIEAQNIPDAEWSDVAWFFHPSVYWLQALGLTKYYQAYQLGGTQSPMKDGVERRQGLRGKLYDIPLYVSTNVVDNLGGYRNLLCHKNAFGYGIQTPGGNKVRVQSEYMLENLGLLLVTDMVYGTTVVRDPVGVVVTVSDSLTTNA